MRDDLPPLLTALAPQATESGNAAHSRAFRGTRRTFRRRDTALVHTWRPREITPEWRAAGGGTPGWHGGSPT